MQTDTARQIDAVRHTAIQSFIFGITPHFRKGRQKALGGEKPLWPSECSDEPVRTMRHIATILCIAGILLVGYSLYEVASGRIYQARRGRELDRVLNSLPPRPAPRRAVVYDQGSAIGRLEVPRIRLSVVVLEGSDAGTLRLGVGRVRNSSIPGEPGNVVLAGHRDTFFRSLREIRRGDQISLRTPEGTFLYTVDWTTAVNPKDTRAIMPTPSPALTLVTCYPFSYVGSARQRFIVRALPAGTMSATAPPPAARRPSPFDQPAKPARHAVVTPDLPAVAPVSSEQSVDTAPTFGTSAAITPVAPVASASIAPPNPVPRGPTVAPAGEPQPAPDPSTERHKGPLKRAFHKIAGVFSPHRDKMQ
jgi:sortase A